MTLSNQKQDLKSSSDTSSAGGFSFAIHQEYTAAFEVKLVSEHMEL